MPPSSDPLPLLSPSVVKLPASSVTSVSLAHTYASPPPPGADSTTARDEGRVSVILEPAPLQLPLPLVGDRADAAARRHAVK